MKVLGIETSTRVGTLAFVEDARVCAEETISDNLRHAGSFEKIIQKVLQKADANLSEVDAIAVGLGPGSFTGVRVGLTIAKGLSLSLKKPLWGVGTLEALVYQNSLTYPKICPIISGEGSEVYGALFEKKAEHFQKTLDEFNTPIEKLLSVLGGPAFFFGPALEKQREELEKLLGRGNVDSQVVFPKASSVAVLAQDALWRIEGEKAVPKYVKPPPFRYT